jgi:hypothetical protein
VPNVCMYACVTNRTLQRHKNAYQEICAEWKESRQLSDIKRVTISKRSDSRHIEEGDSCD